MASTRPHDQAGGSAVVDPSTQLSSSIIIEDVDEIGPVKSGVAQIDFLSLWPIHADEMGQVLVHGSDALLDLLFDAGCELVIDPQRPSILHEVAAKL